ncbi:MAG: hypothetical protein WDM89_19380 [Rhizomicrobium sp.]
MQLAAGPRAWRETPLATVSLTVDVLPQPVSVMANLSPPFLTAPV